MRGRRLGLLGVLIVAATLMLITTASAAEPERKGVSIKVLAEFPSDVPGIAKLRLVELRIEPGGYSKNLTRPATGL